MELGNKPNPKPIIINKIFTSCHPPLIIVQYKERAISETKPVLTRASSAVLAAVPSQKI
jgi:hypothetical protein